MFVVQSYVLKFEGTRVPRTVQGFSNGKKGKYCIMHFFISFLGKMTDQDVKYLEDLQEEFDFRYKTIQSLGKSFLIPIFRFPRKWLILQLDSSTRGFCALLK